MSEYLSIEGINMLFNNAQQLNNSPQKVEINDKNKKIFNLIFDSPEKCQTALDAIRNGKLGNASKYLSVITALEHKLSNEYNNPTFSIEQRKSMKNGWDYATKELELIFNKNTFLID